MDNSYQSFRESILLADVTILKALQRNLKSINFSYILHLVYQIRNFHKKSVGSAR